MYLLIWAIRFMVLYLLVSAGIITFSMIALERNRGKGVLPKRIDSVLEIFCGPTLFLIERLIFKNDVGKHIHKCEPRDLLEGETFKEDT